MARPVSSQPHRTLDRLALEPQPHPVLKILPAAPPEQEKSTPPSPRRQPPMRATDPLAIAPSSRRAPTKRHQTPQPLHQTRLALHQSPPSLHFFSGGRGRGVRRRNRAADPERQTAGARPIGGCSPGRCLPPHAHNTHRVDIIEEYRGLKRSKPTFRILQLEPPGSVEACRNARFIGICPMSVVVAALLQPAVCEAVSGYREKALALWHPLYRLTPSVCNPVNGG